LVDGEFNVKVGDFGSSRMLKNVKERMTQISTIDTSAPEVLKDATYTPSSDIFSFGICLWQLMFELPLYPDQNIYEISTKVIQGSRPPIPKDSTVPKSLIQLMQKCWERSPNKRPKWEEIISILQVLKKEFDAVPQPDAKKE
jgi:serine/threonine protein kinase